MFRSKLCTAICRKIFWSSMVRKRLKHYFDYLDYKDMSDDPDNYFKNKKLLISILYIISAEEILHRKVTKITKQYPRMISKITQKLTRIRFFLLFFVTMEMIYGLKGIWWLNMLRKMFNILNLLYLSVCAC